MADDDSSFKHIRKCKSIKNKIAFRMKFLCTLAVTATLALAAAQQEESVAPQSWKRMLQDSVRSD